MRRQASGGTGRECSRVGVGPATAAVLAALAGGPVASAAITDPPGVLDFGLVFGGWGVYADGDGEPSIPNQSYEIYGVPTNFDDLWSMEESGAFASSRLHGGSVISEVDGSLVLEIGVTASVFASVGPDAPSPDAVAIAEAFIDEIYLSFEVTTAAQLTVESLESDGGWITINDVTLSPGFSDLTLGGGFLSITAGPNESLEDSIDLTWRVTLTTVPGPAGTVLLVLAGVSGGRRRRPHAV
jgi:hypothetical protein